MLRPHVENVFGDLRNGSLCWPDVLDLWNVLDRVDLEIESKGMLGGLDVESVGGCKWVWKDLGARDFRLFLPCILYSLFLLKFLN